MGRLKTPHIIVFVTSIRTYVLYMLTNLFILSPYIMVTFNPLVLIGNVYSPLLTTMVAFNPLLLIGNFQFPLSN
jgi:hypothetical protein